MLIKHGARLDRKSASGKTALDYAEKNNNKNAIQAIKRAGE